jgi:hypothetical protein
VTNKNIVVTYGVSSLSQDTIVEIASVYDEHIKTFTVQSSVFDFEANGDLLYCLCNDSMQVYSLTEGNRVKSVDFDKNYHSIIEIENKKFILMRPDEARIFLDGEN